MKSRNFEKVEKVKRPELTDTFSMYVNNKLSDCFNTQVGIIKIGLLSSTVYFKVSVCFDVWEEFHGLLVYFC